MSGCEKRDGAENVLAVELAIIIGEIARHMEESTIMNAKAVAKADERGDCKRVSKDA